MRYLVLAALVGISCGNQEQSEPEAEPANEKCPKVSLDGLTGRWIRVDGNRGDHTTRFELVSGDGGMEMWFTGGFFTKKRLKGERRKKDYRFTEIPNEKKKAAYEGGSESLVRLYVEPRIETCSLRVSTMEVHNKDGKESERPKPGFTE